MPQYVVKDESGTTFYMSPNGGGGLNVYDENGVFYNLVLA